MKAFRNYSTWVSLLTAAISLGVVLYLKSNSPFESGNVAHGLELLAAAITVLTFVLGIVALPRWQGFVSLSAAGLSAYFILFTAVYSIH